MKALVIAEKPSVAMALASVLGARTRKDGYVEGNGYIVSWCVGHLVGLCDASEYDEKYKKWRYEDLPIVPEQWKHKVLDGTKKQFGILKKLMRDSEVNAVICAFSRWISQKEPMPPKEFVNMMKSCIKVVAITQERMENE